MLGGGGTLVLDEIIEKFSTECHENTFDLTLN